MTNIKFFKTKGKFVGIECSGHTGYDDFGKDVLCATISGIVQSTYLGLSQVLGINVKLQRNIDNGYIKFELPKNIEDDILNNSQILLQTLYISIEDLQKGYSKYISMEVIE